MLLQGGAHNLPQIDVCNYVLTLKVEGFLFYID